MDSMRASTDETQSDFRVALASLLATDRVQGRAYILDALARHHSAAASRSSLEVRPGERQVL